MLYFFILTSVLIAFWYFKFASPHNFWVDFFKSTIDHPPVKSLLWHVTDLLALGFFSGFVYSIFSGKMGIAIMLLFVALIFAYIRYMLSPPKK